MIGITKRARGISDVPEPSLFIRVRFPEKESFAILSHVRPHRLTVRTAGFHSANRGSIPRGVT